MTKAVPDVGDILDDVLEDTAEAEKNQAAH